MTPDRWRAATAAILQLLTAVLGIAAVFGYVLPGEQIAALNVSVSQLMGALMALSAVLPSLIGSLRGACTGDACPLPPQAEPYDGTPPRQSGRALPLLLAMLAVALMLVGTAGTLVGCGSGPLQAQRALLASCTTYTALLEALAPMRAAGQLTHQQIRDVDQARHVAGPICEGSLPADTPAALRTLATAITNLEAAQGAQAAPAAAASGATTK